jgi:hypothetical protein
MVANRRSVVAAMAAAGERSDGYEHNAANQADHSEDAHASLICSGQTSFACFTKLHVRGHAREIP